MFQDAYFRDLQEALEEVRRRRTSPEGSELITKLEESPYEGYRVRSVPADFMIDLMVDGITSQPKRYKLPA